MRKANKLFLLLSLCCLMASCSPERRLARLLKQHPHLIKSDTVFRADTIFIAGSNSDTVFKNTITKDTIIIKENNLTIKYFNSGDSVFVYGECDTIRLIREIPIITNSVSYVERKTKWWDWVIRILCLLALGGLASVMFIHLRKK